MTDKRKYKSKEWKQKLSDAHKGQIPWCTGMILVPIEEQHNKRIAYRRDWNERNREKLREQSKLWRQNHREEINAKARKRYIKNKESELNRHRKQSYGIDEEIYFELVNAQNGTCLICGDKPSINLSVDHNHKTGKIRGLICNPCNIAIAKAKDSPEILRAMADYLEKYDG